MNILIISLKTIAWIMLNTLLYSLLLARVCAEDVVVGSFSTSGIDNWVEESFVGETEYRLFKENQQMVLQGSANKSASILYRKVDINLLETPWLNWSWKISDTYGDINEKSRNGDDYPARIYVIIKTGFFPWNTFAMNYVWSSSSQIGETWGNAYTGNARMLAMQSGNSLVNKWVHERRNVLEDIRQYLDKEITSISGVAIMVDTDDTGKQTTSWFGDIVFSAK